MFTYDSSHWSHSCRQTKKKSDVKWGVYSFQMYNTARYLYAQYNQLNLSKTVRFGSSYLIIRAEIDTHMAMLMLETVFDRQ